MKPPKGPVILEGPALDGESPEVAAAPQVPEAAPPSGAAMVHATALAARGGGRFGRLVGWSLGGLIGLAVSVAAWDFATAMLARNPVLGWVVWALLAVVLLGVLAVLGREAFALVRMRRLGAVQARAAAPAARLDRAVALSAVREVRALYTGRAEARLALADLAAREAEMLDADHLMDETERRLMAPLDAAAGREVEAAARTVAAATALVPLALVDVAVALAANLRMIRRIAEIYGGRGGALSSWRLTRSVARHLIATGAVAVGDDMVGSILGGGALARLSRRFGEGVINGALTARVGLAAIEVCRPMPFAAEPRPRVAGVVQRALTGLFASRKEETGAR